tara:strand:- start:29834 stop:31321 length:1488 start_codon:yes stop_codon:yes gene_type:complete
MSDATEKDFREIVDLLSEAKDAANTGPRADAALDRAIKLVIASAKSSLVREGTPSQAPPVRPPQPSTDVRAPAEPEIRKPRRRDFKYNAETNETEALSDHAKSLRTGNFRGQYSMAKALKAYMTAHPGLLPVVGVHGKMPEKHPLVIGKSQWGSSDPRGAWHETHPLNAVFIGETPDAEIKLGIGGGGGHGDIDQLGVWDLGIRGGSDSFIIRQLAKVNAFLMDGCWWLTNEEFTGNQMHGSGMHFGEGYDFFVWRNHQFKGALLAQHLFYDKAGPGRRGTWLIGNDLKGGNRTGSQRRPHPDVGSIYGQGGSEPDGLYYAARNHADGYGWTHGDGGHTYDGGSCLSNWCNPNADVWYLDNVIEDSKYGCIMTSWQPASNGNFANAEGRTFDRVFLGGNKLTNVRGDRAAVSLSSANEIHLLPGNEIIGNGDYDLILDSPWAAGHGARPNGRVLVHGEDTLAHLKTLKVGSYMPSVGDLVRLSPDQLERMLVSHG